MMNTNEINQLTLEEQNHYLREQLIKKEKLVVSQSEKITTQLARITRLEARIQLLLHRQYSVRSEKLKAIEMAGQLSLFDEENAPLPEEPVAETPEIEVKGHQRKKGGGRRALSKAFPRIRREYCLTESERRCGCCGNLMACIGETSMEQLEVIPAVMYVIEHVRKKYACKGCQEGIKQASQPSQPIAKSLAGPSLLAHVAVCKFCDGLPLYRQESILQRSGVELNRASLSQWMRRCGELLCPLVEKMSKTINHYDVAFADETPVQVLKEPGRQAQTKSYMWVFSGGPPEKFSIVYHYSPGRQGQVASDFFEGYEGYLHADGYSGYNLVCSMGTKRVGCWAHARRKYVEVIKGIKKRKKRGLADEALARISQLYTIERKMKTAELSADEIKAVRETQATPIITAFKQWLDEHQPKTSANTLIGKALNDTLNHWPSLHRYLADGRLEIDNNRSERFIKPFVIGRKGWLFYDQVNGAKAGAILYSLIETCKYHQIDPYLWLRYTLKYLPQADSEKSIDDFLPYHCDPDILKQDLEKDRQLLTHALKKIDPPPQVSE